MTHGTRTSFAAEASEELDALDGGMVTERPATNVIRVLRERVHDFLTWRPDRPARVDGQPLADGNVAAEDEPFGYPAGKRLADLEASWKVTEVSLRACGWGEDEIASHRVTFATAWWRADVTR